LLPNQELLFTVGILQGSVEVLGPQEVDALELQAQGRLGGERS